MLYKVELEQKTESIGEIKASTLFGAFVTAYSNYTDIDKDLIDDIVLSDLFIKGQIPIGIKNNNTVFNKVSKSSKVINITRTMVSRGNDNNVVNVRQAKYNKHCEFYIYTELLDKAELEKIINTMLMIGIGTWRSVGKGQFTLKGIEEYIPDIEKTKFVTLSAFVPTEKDLSNINETGYEIRNAVASNGKKQQVVTLLKTGTTFNIREQIVGKHVYDKDSETYIHGKSIVLGV